MIESAVKDYIRVINSISLPQTDREIIEEFLLKQVTASKKEISKKYVAAASAFAVVAVGVFLAARERRQDFKF